MALESSVTAVAGDTATLSCELYGYVSSDEITWRFNDRILETGDNISITTEEGNRMLQNGGETPRASIISHLTTTQTTSSQDGTYVCNHEDMGPRIVSLTITG